MTMITSLQNPRVKDAVRLRDRAASPAAAADPHRRRARVGPRDRRRRARRRSVRLRGALPGSTTPGGCWPPCAAAAAKFCAVSRPVFEKLAFGHRAEGVLGVAEMPQRTLARTRRCRTIRWWPCWKAWRSRATSAPCSAAPTAPASRPLIVADAAHRPVQPQRHPRQPGHDLHRAGVRGRRATTCWPGCAGKA